MTPQNGPHRAFSCQAMIQHYPKKNATRALTGPYNGKEGKNVANKGNDTAVQAVMHRKSPEREAKPVIQTPEPKAENPRKIKDGVKVNILIRQQTLDALKEKAWEQRTTYNELVRKLLEDYTGTRPE